MQRQTLQSLLDIPSSRGSDETRKPRLPKSLPSGSQLPSCWNEAMDRAICHMEAQNEVYASAMVRLLKRRFPELDGYVIPVEAIERRIETLELQENDYFRNGTETAVANAEASGFVLPVYDPAKYPGRKFVRKSDLEVYGSGSPMAGVLGYGASNVPEDETITRGVGKVSIGDRSKTTTPGKSLDNQRNARSGDLGTRRVQLAGEYVQTHNLTDITNVHSSPGLPVTGAAYSNPPLPTSISNPAMKAANTPLPVTPVNAHGNQYFSSPSSKDKQVKPEGALLPSRTYVSTPSSKDKNHSKAATGNSHSTAQYISPPSGKFGKANAAGSSSGHLYRSGKENTTSGMSSTTTGTSILGRDIPGMSAALERRHLKIDHRATPDD